MSLDSLNRKVGLKLDKSGGEVSGDLNVNGNLEAKSVLVNGFDISQIIPTGSVLPFAGSSAPQSYLLCDGKAVSRSQYSGLFQVIGTQYGFGNGSTTFNVPDLRWTFIRGFGSNISVTGSGNADAAANTAFFKGHGFNRTGVKVRLSSGTLSGLATATDYWVIVSDENNLAFATTKANAISNTRIALSGSNTAVIVQFEDPSAGTREQNSPGAGSGSVPGSYQTDQIQGHWHNLLSDSGYALAGGGFNAQPRRPSGDLTQYGDMIRAPVTDGTNGTPRVGFETRPVNISMNYIIKI